jgi:hypothetical protein
MNGLRKNSLNICLFIFWLGLGFSLTLARAEDASGGGSKVEGYTIDLSFITHLDASLPEQDVSSHYCGYRYGCATFQSGKSDSTQSI